MSPRMTCLYRYTAELLKARSLKAVLVGELCQTAYERLEAASPFTRRQQQSMRMFTAHMQSCIKRVTSECDYQSRIVWPREGSGRVKRQVLCLQMLSRTKNTKLRKAILEYADADLISALCECAHNTLRGTVRLTPREKVRLRKHKNKLRLLANRRLSITKRRREIHQNGGFLPALLAPLATTVFLPLLRQLFA